MRHVLNSPCLFLFRWRGEQVEECQPFRYIHLGNWVGENINRENFYTCYISFLHRNHETVDSMLKSRHFLNNKTHFLDDVELLCTVEHTIQILSWYFKCIETQKSTVMNIIYSKKENCQNGLSRRRDKKHRLFGICFFLSKSSAQECPARLCQESAGSKSRWLETDKKYTEETGSCKTMRRGGLWIRMQMDRCDPFKMTLVPHSNNTWYFGKR